MAIHIDINRAAIEQQLASRWTDQVLPQLSARILTDCNRYCKVDTGALAASALASSNLQQGRLVWSAPYARRQYYLISASRGRGTWRWAHQAKSAHQGAWTDTAQQLFDASGR